MNYTKSQLESMPNLAGSTSVKKLKVSNETSRVWLFTYKKFNITKNEVIIEELQGGNWLTVKQYSV